MEIAYEGKIKKNLYFISNLFLKSKLFLLGLHKSINTYWDKSECAPIAEINSSRLLFKQIKKLGKICLNSGFMVKK